jgi:hypothetical protein
MVNVVVSSRAMRALTLRVALVFVLVLVFLVATVAFGMVRLGLARTTTVLALLDGATLGVDVMQLAIWTERRNELAVASGTHRVRRAYRCECIRSLDDP